LPFYPSPGRDDGYDIADYGAINPDFGTMKVSAASSSKQEAGLKSLPNSSSIILPTSTSGSRARRSDPKSSAQLVCLERYRPEQQA
jgi:maltose alpha-D-glucosyltransferase/alpha-amylase